jgi:predicted ATPase/class 3 adenylate cyclase
VTYGASITFTFWFSDLESSTRLWEEHPEAMKGALARHDAIMSEAIVSTGGAVVKTTGDGVVAVFEQPRGAVLAASDVQRRLAHESWGETGPLRCRIGIHVGPAQRRADDYFGPTLNRTARIMAVAHGGQILLSGAAAELVRGDLPTDTGLVDLGQHRLRDLARPEHLFQLTGAGLTESFPPLATLNAIANNLPVQLTDFVGRQVELEDAKRLVSESRLVTIIAPGGMGKTRLAIQAAADLSYHFPDGLFFVDLTPISSPSDIIQTVAESLRIALSTGEDPLAQLLTYLRTKRLLLVFDNFEHVVDGAAIVGEILKGAPEIRVLATSRTKLDVLGENVMALLGLETEWSSPEAAFQAGSVQLFIDTAERADSSFELSSNDLEPLGQILELVGGLPLGIVLAASWTNVLPVSEIASEIAKSVDFLEAEGGGMPDRHRNMRAVFDYSWAMLTEEERQVFSALSIFRGGFTRDAASTIAGASIRHLSALASKSLLSANRETGRYSIHELLRQYAAEALEEDADQSQSVRTAYVDFFADLAAQLEGLVKQSDQVTMLERAEADLDNVRLAFLEALGRGDASAARRFMLTLWFVYEIRGWHQAAVTLFGEVLDAFSPDAVDDATRLALALAGGCRAWFMALLGQAEASIGPAAAGVRVLEGFDDISAYAIATQGLCVGYSYLNRWEDQLKAATAVMRRSDMAGEIWPRAEIQSYAAWPKFQIGEFEEGLRLLLEDEEILTRLGEIRALGWVRLALGIINLRQDEAAKAAETFAGIVESADTIGYQRLSQITLQYLGDALFADGDRAGADRAFVESLARSDQMGSRLDMAGTLARLARVRAASGRAVEAVSLLSSVLADPISSQTLLIEDVPITQAAEELLAQLEKELGSDTYRDAYATGTARSIELTAKEVLSTASGSGSVTNIGSVSDGRIRVRSTLR